ncbi:MAG: hypothetical protein ACOYN3_09595 [Acidimicrobiia bacterium]
MFAQPQAQFDFEARKNHPSMRAVAPAPLAISCDACVMQASDACGDCVVSFIVNRAPGDALIIDVCEARALRTLADAGLVPELRHAPQR